MSGAAAINQKLISDSANASPEQLQTRTAMMPNDWSIRRISDFSKPVRGGSPRPAGDRRYFNGSYIPWLTVAALTNIPDSRIVVDKTESSLTEAGANFSRRLIAGTLIIANSGATLGVAKRLGIDCCANDGIAALLNVDPGLSIDYLIYFINSQTAILRGHVATGNGQPNLNTTLIGNITVPIPPTYKEQQAIAEALGDADALIESLEQLIAKKRAIKQGAMHELLTGKRRLPGFKGEWEKRSLGEVGRWVGGATPSMRRKDYWDGGAIPWASSSDVRIGPVKSTVHQITDKAITESSTTLVPSGSLLVVARSGILRRFLPVGIAVHKIAINQDIKALLPSPRVLGAFVFHAMVGAGHAILGNCLKSGTTVESIELSWLKRFEIDLPKDADEQAAIATVLSEMDAELEALDAKLAKARAVKHGMVQELLTGRVRLI